MKRSVPPVGRADENREPLAGSLYKRFQRLEDRARVVLGVALQAGPLVPAHQRKSFGEFGEAVRGSNALTGGVDVVLELERPRADVLSGDGVRVLQAVSRFASTPEALVIALGEDGYEARGDTLEAQADVERALILDALEVLGEAGYEKLHDETGLPRTSVQRRLEELGDQVSKKGAGKRGDPFLFFRPTPTGRKESEELPPDPEIERLAELSLLAQEEAKREQA